MMMSFAEHHLRPYSHLVLDRTALDVSVIVLDFESSILLAIRADPPDLATPTISLLLYNALRALRYRSKKSMLGYKTSSNGIGKST